MSASPQSQAIPIPSGGEIIEYAVLPVCFRISAESPDNRMAAEA